MSEDDRKIYIGKLPFRHTKDDLFEMFTKYGKVEDAFIIRDRETGRSRGFGFVIFESEDCMEEAINALNDLELDGRNLVVQKAGKRRGGGGGGGGGGGSYRQGGGYQGGRGGGGGGYRGNRDYGGRGGGYGDDRRYGGGGRSNYDDEY